MFIRQLISFGLIGLLNTLIDIGSYTLLLSIGSPLVVAIFVSTSLGLACSYTLNRQLTFHSRRHSVGRFLFVTLIGLWVLQPLIILGGQQLFSFTTTLQLTVMKLLATGITMVWNFAWYKTNVFAA